jgi:hypothetical protein
MDELAPTFRSKRQVVFPFGSMCDLHKRPCWIDPVIR